MCLLRQQLRQRPVLIEVLEVRVGHAEALARRADRSRRACRGVIMERQAIAASIPLRTFFRILIIDEPLSMFSDR